MMKCVFGAGSNSEDARKCVAEAVKDFQDPKLIMFFSHEHRFNEYAALIHEMFPNVISIGCTAYRLWGPSVKDEDLLKVMSIEDGIICSGGVIEKADNSALSYIENVRRCMDEVGVKKDTVCVEFTVPFKRAEEYALMALNSVLLRNGIQVVGGSAGNSVSDQGYKEEAYVSLNGKVYTHGCVFVIIHNMGGRIFTRRENIYEPLTGDELMVTKANNVTRIVMNYNNKPAAEVYAEQVGCDHSEIQKYFFHHPMGRWQGEEVYMTAIQGEGSNGSMKHLARVHEGTRMMVMKEADFRSISNETIWSVKSEAESPSLVLLFNCTARTKLYEETGYISEYKEKLADAFPNYIGFSCNGEQLGTKHFNHTLLLAIFE